MTERSSKTEQLNALLHRGHGAEGPAPGGADAPNSEVAECVRKWLIHYDVQLLHGPEEVAFDSDELVVLCLVRDGRPYVRSFIDHYLSLGVRHIFFLDNGSTDGTVEVAREYDNVTVFRSLLPFKVYQMQIKQYLIERFAYGRWSLCVDIDELFDYPYSDVVSLSSLLNYLSGRSYTAVLTQMLDMFPEKPLTDAAISDQDEPLKELYRFYDVANIHAHDYSTHTGICGPGNTLANDEIAVYKDGIKGTIFDRNTPVLTKHALTFLDDKIRPMDGNAHKASNARVADITCVLFHYKFTNNLYESVRLAVQRENYNKDSRKHKMYLKTLEEKSSLQLKSATSRELRGVNELVHNQFLVISRAYMRLVQNEEPNRANRIVHDETHKMLDALFETRAETRVRIRDADERQQQLQQQVKKLEKRLSRKHEERDQHAAKLRELQQQARKQKQQVRDLQRQMQDIRSSKAWKLLNKFALLRAKMLGEERTGSRTS